MNKSNYIRRLALAVALGAWLGMCYGAIRQTQAPSVQFNFDPCYSAEHGEILPPLYGTDC